MTFDQTITPGYAMVMSPNNDETAIHGCNFTGKLTVRMPKVLTNRQSRSQSPRSLWSAETTRRNEILGADQKDRGL